MKPPYLKFIMNRRRPRDSPLLMTLMAFGNLVLGCVMLVCLVALYLLFLGGFSWLVRWVLPTP